MIKVLDLKQRDLTEDEQSELKKLGNFKSAHENFRYESQRRVSVLKYTCSYPLCFKIFKTKTYLDIHLKQHETCSTTPTPYFKSLFDSKSPSRRGFFRLLAALQSKFLSCKDTDKKHKTEAKRAVKDRMFYVIQSVTMDQLTKVDANGQAGEGSAINLNNHLYSINQTRTDGFNNFLYNGVSKLNQKEDTRPWSKLVFAYLLANLDQDEFADWHENLGSEELQVVKHLKDGGLLSITPFYLEASVLELLLLEKSVTTIDYPNKLNRQYGDLNWVYLFDANEEIHKLRTFFVNRLSKTPALCLDLTNLNLLFKHHLEFVKHTGIKLIGKTHEYTATLRWASRFLGELTPSLTAELGANLAKHQLSKSDSDQSSIVPVVQTVCLCGCGSRFVLESDAYHMHLMEFQLKRVASKDVETLKCFYCARDGNRDYTFSRASLVDNHIKHHHGKQKVVEQVVTIETANSTRCLCGCTKYFILCSEEYRSHLCFVQQNRLDRQETSGDVCSFCGMKYTQNSANYHHIKDVHGRQKVDELVVTSKTPNSTRCVCGCGKLYIRLSKVYIDHLVEEYKVRISNKQATRKQCPFCPASFTDNTNCYRHIRQVCANRKI